MEVLKGKMVSNYGIQGGLYREGGSYGAELSKRSVIYLDTFKQKSKESFPSGK